MLVIIDLQEYYESEFRKQKKKFKRMLSHILKRIDQAEKNEEPIINLTHVYDGFTIYEVVEELKNKDNVHFLEKEGFDGSASVHFYSKRRKLNTNSIELCGAFYDCCVLKTWQGLKDREYNVQPVNPSLTIRTSKQRKIKYPNGYFTEEIKDGF